MIALRRRIERGLANPWLRPFLIIVLAVMLAFVVIHAAHDGSGTAPDAGAACLGIVIVLSSVLLQAVRSFAPPRLVLVRSDRAPPRRRRPIVDRGPRTGLLQIPLRR